LRNSRWNNSRPGVETLERATERVPSHPILGTFAGCCASARCTEAIANPKSKMTLAFIIVPAPVTAVYCSLLNLSPQLGCHRVVSYATSDVEMFCVVLCVWSLPLTDRTFPVTRRSTAAKL